MATTNPNNNLSPLVPAWVGKTWHVSQVETGKNFGVWAPDTVTFTDTTTGTTVDILSSGQSQNITQSTTSPQSTPWRWGTLEPGSVTASIAASSSGLPIEVSGQTAWGQPFRINYPYGDDETLACYLDAPAPQLPGNAVALGVIAGTLLGATVGFLARSRVIGALAGFAGTTAGLLVARIVTNNGTSSSTPTWVANDGPAGRLIKPGPHPIGRTTPDAARA